MIPIAVERPGGLLEPLGKTLAACWPERVGERSFVVGVDRRPLAAALGASGCARRCRTDASSLVGRTLIDPGLERALLDASLFALPIARCSRRPACGDFGGAAFGFGLGPARCSIVAAVATPTITTAIVTTPIIATPIVATTASVVAAAIIPIAAATAAVVATVVVAATTASASIGTAFVAIAVRPTA